MPEKFVLKVPKNGGFQYTKESLAFINKELGENPKQSINDIITKLEQTNGTSSIKDHVR